MEAKQSQTETQVKVKFSRWVGDRMVLDEKVMFESHFETFKEDLERQGGKVNRWEPIHITAVQLFWKEQTIDGTYHAMQVVDYGGEFLLRHYIGKDKPTEISLSRETSLGTEAYNNYMEEKQLPEFWIDDLAYFCGHTYGYQVG